MFRNHWMTALCAIGLSVGIGCRQGGQTSANPSAQTNSQRVFEVTGVVEEIMTPRNKVRINHDPIPDYMEAMTMDFDVKQTGELDGLSPGDQVSFRMVVTHNDGWIENIRKTGVQRPVASPPDAFTRLRDVEPLKVGEPLPNYVFTNQNGQSIQLHDYRGKVLAFTFIFTRCPFPTFCPRMTSNFIEAQKALSEKGSTNWHLLTLSFDPEFDKPEVLQGYAKGHNADPRYWTFASGELKNIVELGQQLGLVFYQSGDASNPATLTHNLRTVVVGADGTVRKIFTDNEWKPEQLVEEMMKAGEPMPTSG